MSGISTRGTGRIGYYCLVIVAKLRKLGILIAIGAARAGMSGISTCGTGRIGYYCLVIVAELRKLGIRIAIGAARAGMSGISTCGTGRIGYYCLVIVAKLFLEHDSASGACTYLIGGTGCSLAGKMTKCGDLLLSSQYGITYRAMVTLGKTGYGTGRLNTCILFGSMSQSFNIVLRNQNYVTYGTMLSFSLTLLCTCCGNCIINFLGMAGSCFHLVLTGYLGAAGLNGTVNDLVVATVNGTCCVNLVLYHGSSGSVSQSILDIYLHSMTHSVFITYATGLESIALFSTCRSSYNTCIIGMTEWVNGSCRARQLCVAYGTVNNGIIASAVYTVGSNVVFDHCCSGCMTQSVNNLMNAGNFVCSAYRAVYDLVISACNSTGSLDLVFLNSIAGSMGNGGDRLCISVSIIVLTGERLNTGYGTCGILSYTTHIVAVSGMRKNSVCAGKLLITYSTINYCIVAAVLDTSCCNSVFLNGLALGVSGCGDRNIF